MIAATPTPSPQPCLMLDGHTEGHGMRTSPNVLEVFLEGSFYKLLLPLRSPASLLQQLSLHGKCCFPAQLLASQTKTSVKVVRQMQTTVIMLGQREVLSSCSFKALIPIAIKDKSRRTDGRKATFTMGTEPGPVFLAVPRHDSPCLR